MMKPKVELGETVHYVLAAGDPVFTNVHGEKRAAVVVQVHGEGTVSLHVHLDGHNDSNQVPPGSLYWKPGVHEDEKDKQPGTWHKPGKESA